MDRRKVSIRKGYRTPPSDTPPKQGIDRGIGNSILNPRSGEIDEGRASRVFPQGEIGDDLPEGIRGRDGFSSVPLTQTLPVLKHRYGLIPIPGYLPPIVRLALIIVTKAFSPKKAESWKAVADLSSLPTPGGAGPSDGMPNPYANREEEPSGPALSNSIPTFRHSLARWIGQKGYLTPKGIGNLKRMGAAWASALGDFPLDRIRAAEIGDLFNQRNDGHRGSAYLNSEGRRLREFFNWAMDSGFIHSNPVSRRTWPPQRGPEKRIKGVLSYEGELQIIKRLSLIICRFVMFVVSCPLRYGTVKLLTFKMISLSPEGISILAIPGAIIKQRRNFVIALTEKAMKAIGPIGKPDDLIFKGLPTESYIGRELKRAAKECCLNVHLNCTNLRNTWVARMRRATQVSTLELMSIAGIGGWGSIGTLTGHYNPPVPYAQAREWMERADKGSGSGAAG